MCGCNKGAAGAAKRYEVVDAKGVSLGTHVSHPDALAVKRQNPGSMIKVKPAATATQ